MLYYNNIILCKNIILNVGIQRDSFRPSTVHVHRRNVNEFVREPAKIVSHHNSYNGAHIIHFNHNHYFITIILLYTGDQSATPPAIYASANRVGRKCIIHMLSQRPPVRTVKKSTRTQTQIAVSQFLFLFYIIMVSD